MSYCDWSDGDLHAHASHTVDGPRRYVAQVAEPAVAQCGVEAEYVEDSADAFYARLKWLKAQGCAFPADVFPKSLPRRRRTRVWRDSRRASCPGRRRS
ncbi:hypothetical protein QP162_06315 [Sphingomonas aurantiaca]|uniref:hypothetical protein n=1 Tax=Sphingomonas aurantiaca TaxID=185949 RepID=UPI002FE01266